MSFKVYKTINKKGEWKGKWTCNGKDPIGVDEITKKTIYKPYKQQAFYTEKEAEDWGILQQAECVRLFNKQKPVEKTKITLSQLFEIWIQDRAANKQPATVRTDRNVVEKHILPYLGDMRVQKIEFNVLKKWMNTIISSIVNKGSQRAIYDKMKSLMVFAVMDNILDFNPMDKIERPKYKPVQSVESIFPKNERDYILHRTKDDLYHFALFLGFFYGLRRSEIMGLMWKDVDLDRNLLYIRRQIDSTEGIISLKNECTRDLELTPVTIQALTHHKKKMIQQRLYNPDGFVITKFKDNYTTPQVMNRYFNKIEKKFNFKHRTPHDMRKTLATQLIQDNTDVSTVQGILGHTTPTTALSFYVMVNKENEKRAFNRNSEEMSYLY